MDNLFEFVQVTSYIFECTQHFFFLSAEFYMKGRNASFQAVKWFKLLLMVVALMLTTVQLLLNGSLSHIEGLLQYDLKIHWQWRISVLLLPAKEKPLLIHSAKLIRI